MATTSTTPYLTQEQTDAAVAALVDKHGDSHSSRIESGVARAAFQWREADGTPDEFIDFCIEQFVAEPEQVEILADRFAEYYDKLYGHLGEISRALSWHTTVETGPIYPIDELFSQYSPYAHVSEDLYNNKIAFASLLNFERHTLEQRLAEGSGWTRQQWRTSRLGDGFRSRVPAEISQANSRLRREAGKYIRDYNIYMHHVLTEDGRRLFPEGMRLISHWNLRDELKSQYSAADGLPRQQMIFELMLRIINQQIPRVVINNPAVDWKPTTNEVTLSAVVDGPIPDDFAAEGEPGTSIDNSREPDTRYRHWLNVFKTQQNIDPYYPDANTLVKRRFQLNREMPETDVERLLIEVLSAPVVQDIGKLIEERLGRELRPFDIWYDGFKQRARLDADMLDSLTRAKYPDAAAFEADMPRILSELGFDEQTAAFLQARIGVDPSRGVGHASGMLHDQSTARLRTRVGADGMDYKGYNIAVHEFGHNVEQVLSTCRVDYSTLRGVPNTAFTEAFAFVFQSRDLELLGVGGSDPMTDHLKTLDAYWGAFEISGVSLIDMYVWRWLYQHPEATPAELREAVVGIARDVWNDYFAPVFGIRDCEILAIYSHTITGAMYTPDYAIGSLIEFQIEDYLKGKNLGTEMERMCSLGQLTPDAWMKQAVGSPVSAKPFIDAAGEAVREVDGTR
ncbi:hypothetical protein GF420_08250 [candidate division GN15 bacterium]|nr:hypothetical protein [candidate division GN15 bacterium]